MKKLLNNRIGHLLFLSMMLIITIFTSCNNEDDSNAPVITEIRNYAATPLDTVVETANTGQWVVIKGENLSNVTSVTFGRTSADLNTTFITDRSLVVQIPYIKYDLIPREFHNEVRVVTKDGKVATYIFKSNILGSPLITRVRNYADSPNDTLVNVVVPGQKINLIGYNLQKATEISFQGVKIDVTNVVYTDSSAVVQVPEIEDFNGSNLALKNTIKYTNEVGSTTIGIKIDIPTPVGPLMKLLTGGKGVGKTWIYGASPQFQGPLYYGGVDLGWNAECTKAGGECSYNVYTWQSWMGPSDPWTNDYGSMTFTVDNDGTYVHIDQKIISTKGVYDGHFVMDETAKTILFVDQDPLRMGWNDAKYRTTARILSLTDSTMQIAFDHVNKKELQIFNFIAKN